MKMSTENSNNRASHSNNPHVADQQQAQNLSNDTSNNENRAKLVAAIENMKYTELVAECKALRLKPVDRTRQSLVKAILASKTLLRPADDSSNSNTQQHHTSPHHFQSSSDKHANANTANNNNNSTNSDSKHVISDDLKKSLKDLLTKEEYQRFQDIQSGVGENPTNEIILDRPIQLRNYVSRSAALREYDEYILELKEPKDTDLLYYIENYSFEQQQKYIEDMQAIYIQKEFSQLCVRSSFLRDNQKASSLRWAQQEPASIPSINEGDVDSTATEESVAAAAAATINQHKQAKTESQKVVLSQLLAIETEYSDIFQDHVKHFIRQITSSRLSSSSALRITKTLSDPISYWHYASYFKWGSTTSLVSLWKALTLTIDFYDLENIQTLTKCLYMIRKNSRFQTPEETQFYEKLSTIILQIIQEKENQVSYHYIANILGYLKQIGGTFTTKTVKNLQTIAESFVQLYQTDLENKKLQTVAQSMSSSETNATVADSAALAGGGATNYMKSPEEIDNQSPDFQMRVLFALSYYSNPPQIIVDDLFKNLIASGISHFEKAVVIKILSQLMLSYIRLSEELALEIRKNKKIIYDLSLREIYVFIYSFSDSNQELGKLYSHFYYQTGVFLDNVQVLSDFKQIVMIAKIHYYLLSAKINEHKRFYIEKRTTQVLNMINRSCTDVMSRDQVADLIYISTLFIPYINKPDFLYSKIIKNINFLKANSENRPLFTNFISKMLEKFTPQYDLFVNHSNSDLELNDKLTDDAKTLLGLLINKFIESKLLSFFLLTIQLCATPNLLKQVVIVDSERHELTKNLTTQITKILGHENNKFGFSSLVMFSQFLDVNCASIKDEHLLVKATSVIFDSIVKSNQQQAQSTENEDLVWIYYHSNILASVKIPCEAQKKSLYEYFVQKVMKPICENRIGVVNEIIHEDGIVQYFNNNVNHSNLQSIVHLPSIIRNLNIDITSVSKHLMPKIIKESKYWNGEALVDNLLILNSMNIKCFEVFENVCENLFTSFIYTQDTQELILNQAIYPTEDKIIALLTAFSNQLRLHKTENPTYEITIHKRFIALNVLACHAFKSLPIEVITDIFKLMGNTQSLYFKPFVQLVNTSILPIETSDFNTLLEFYCNLPSFIRNKDISYKIHTSLLNHQQFQSIDLVLKYFQKEMIVSDTFTSSFIDHLSHDNKTSNYFERVLEYFSLSSIVKSHQQLETLQRYYNIFFDSLTSESHLNMLQVIAGYQLANHEPIHLPPTIALHEPSFFKNLNRVTINGTHFDIPFQESFEIYHEVATPQYKIYPAVSNIASIPSTDDSANSANNSSSDAEESVSLNSKTNPLAGATFEYIKSQVNRNSQSGNQNQLKHQTKALSRFYLYHLMVKPVLKANNAQDESFVFPEEERIVMEFRQAQQESQNLLKNENYANFLVDFMGNLSTNAGGQFDLETNLLLEDKRAIADIALQHKSEANNRIAIIYVDQVTNKLSAATAASNLSGVESQQSMLTTLTKLKIEYIEKHLDWSVYPIHYQQWSQVFNTPESKELFVHKILKKQADTTAAE